MKRVAILLIRAYQLSLRHLFPPVCRFEPTCSNYAIESISRYGVFKGVFLSLWRIIRCNPFFEGGWDPVPMYGKKVSCSEDGVK